MKRRKIHYLINFIALLEDWFDKDVNIKQYTRSKEDALTADFLEFLKDYPREDMEDDWLGWAFESSLPKELTQTLKLQTGTLTDMQSSLLLLYSTIKDLKERVKNLEENNIKKRCNYEKY